MVELLAVLIFAQPETIKIALPPIVVTAPAPIKVPRQGH